MNENRILNQNGYELTFEGKGSSYLYNTTFCQRSLPNGWEFVAINLDGHVKEFLSKATLRSLNQEGMDLTLKRVQQAIIDLDTKAFEERKKIDALLRTSFTAESILEVFQRCGEVALTYAFFDPHSFEALYERKDEEAKASIALVQEYKNKARSYLNTFYFEDGFIPRLIQRLTREINVPEYDLTEYDEYELSATLEGRFVDPHTLADRRKACVLIRDSDGRMIAYIGDEASAYAKHFLVSKDEISSDIVTGTCAHETGRTVEGRVRVITRDYANARKMSEEMQAMQSGEILVTQTTDPEMLPALQKASAVITDIGGMLSHAAITSRELNIPCLVGTKNATHILKNGDLLEIDAKNGIARKISKD